MSTFENNNNGTNEFWYDKNEFYTENGLAKGHKKDRKSRSKKALEQAEERQNKQDEHISQLPTKMQKLLLEAKAIKAVKAYKSVKEDPDLAKSSGKIHKKFANPVKNTSQNVFYNDAEDHEEEYYDKEPLRDKAYADGLNMWERYGLTKQQYDADLEHRSNIAALDAFNQDPENYLAPDYGRILEERIKKYEDEFEAKKKAEEEAQRYVNWYNPNDLDLDLDDPFEDWSYPVEETEEDMAERYREDRFESAIENARDDMRDDY